MDPIFGVLWKQWNWNTDVYQEGKNTIGPANLFNSNTFFIWDISKIVKGLGILPY